MGTTTTAQPASQLPPRRAGQSLQVHGNPTHTSIDTSAATGNRESTAGTQSADAAVRFDGSAPTSDWATKMSTTESLRSSVFRRRSSRHDEPFVPVVARRAKHQRQHSSPAAAATNTRVRSSPPTAAQRQDMPQRRTFMYGQSFAVGAKVAAAQIIPRKAIFCLDNLSRSCSVDDSHQIVCVEFVCRTAVKATSR